MSFAFQAYCEQRARHRNLSQLEHYRTIRHEHAPSNATDRALLVG